MKVSEDEAKKLWRTADCVCFDVDSTVCMDEGLDELAKYLGKAEAVSEITRKAMSGGMSFREALQLRLKILKPSQQQVLEFVCNHPVQLTPGVDELIDKLRARNAHVYLISGGFRALIEPVAQLLNLPVDNIIANKFLFK